MRGYDDFEEDDYEGQEDEVNIRVFDTQVVSGANACLHRTMGMMNEPVRSILKKSR